MTTQSVHDTPTEHVVDTQVRPVPRQPATADGPGQNDLFHARVPTDYIAQVFAVMALTPQHTYKVLTKRPNRMRRLLADRTLREATYHRLLALRRDAPVVWSQQQADALAWPAARVTWPLPNVWLGTSIESNDYTWRAGHLRRADAATKFLSCEPLLGPLPSLDLTGIDWVIVGGESGPKARTLDLDWVRDIRDQCIEHHVPLFFKQVGGRTPKAGGRLLDGRTWDEYPDSPTAGELTA